MCLHFFRLFSTAASPLQRPCTAWPLRRPSQPDTRLRTQMPQGIAITTSADVQISWQRCGPYNLLYCVWEKDLSHQTVQKEYAEKVEGRLQRKQKTTVGNMGNNGIWGHGIWYLSIIHWKHLFMSHGNNPFQWRLREEGKLKVALDPSTWYTLGE